MCLQRLQPTSSTSHPIFNNWQLRLDNQLMPFEDLPEDRVKPPAIELLQQFNEEQNRSLMPKID